MKYLIGIDGGATKTTVAVADESGKILSQGTAGPGNLRAVAKKDLIKSILGTLDQVLKSIGNDHQAVAVCMGIAEHDTESDHLYALELLGEMFPQIEAKNRQAYNDVVIGRRSNSNKPYGLCIISGTGSHGYGINEAGEEAYVSGLGWVLADEGSAYQVGLAGLRAAARSDDGREKSILEKFCKEKLKVKTMRDSIEQLFKSNKTEIATFAPLVDRAADEGDEVAKRILQGSADELILMVETLVRRLDLSQTECDLVLIGSMINKNQILKERFAKQISTKFPNLTIVPANNDPVLGAIRLAKDEFER